MNKEKFLALLHHSIKEIVELKDPNSYDNAVRVSIEPWKKRIRRQELSKKEESKMVRSPLVKPLPINMHVKPHVEILRHPVENVSQEALHQDMKRLMEQLGNLNLSMQAIQTQGQRPPQGRGQENWQENAQCYNYWERGHISTNSPHPRREPRAMYPL